MPAMPSAAPWESAHRHPSHPGHSAAAARPAAVPRCAESPLRVRHGGAEAPALRGWGRGDVPWKFPALCALAATEVVVFLLVVHPELDNTLANRSSHSAGQRWLLTPSGAEDDSDPWCDGCVQGDSRFHPFATLLWALLPTAADQVAWELSTSVAWWVPPLLGPDNRGPPRPVGCQGPALMALPYVDPWLCDKQLDVSLSFAEMENMS